VTGTDGQMDGSNYYTLSRSAACALELRIKD